MTTAQLDPDRATTFDNGQNIRDRTFAFACRAVKFCQSLYAEGGASRLMAPQIIDCTTSMATMIEEAKAAESDADFISKCCISLKEGRESWTRLRVCLNCRLGPPDEAQALVGESDQLVAIITTIISNKRRNVARDKGSSRLRLRSKILNS